MLLGWVATKRAVFCWQLAMFLRYIRPCSDSLSALPMSVWAIWLAPHGPFCRAWTISTLAILWRFIIMFLILVCWQPESMVVPTPKSPQTVPISCSPNSKPPMLLWFEGSTPLRLLSFRPCLCSFRQCRPIISNWGTSIQTAHRPMVGGGC